MKKALEKEIDNILDEGFSNAFLERMIDRKLNRRLTEKIDQMLEDPRAQRYYKIRNKFSAIVLTGQSSLQDAAVNRRE